MSSRDGDEAVAGSEEEGGTVAAAARGEAFDASDAVIAAAAADDGEADEGDVDGASGVVGEGGGAFPCPSAFALAIFEIASASSLLEA